MRLTALPTTYGVDPWSSESVQQLPVGAIGYDEFGNAFRYGQQNATTDAAASKLYQSLPIDTAFIDMAVQAAAAVGAKTISVTLGGSSTTANQFSGGYLNISVTPGLGQRFTVLSHDVATNGTTAKFNTLETVVTALTTSSKVSVIANPYATGIVINPTARTGQIVGVPAAVITKAQWGWYQTHGNASVLCDATVPTSIGNGVSPSTTTAGSVTKAVTLIDRIGTFYVLGVSAQVEPVFLNIN